MIEPTIIKRTAIIDDRDAVTDIVKRLAFLARTINSAPFVLDGTKYASGELLFYAFRVDAVGDESESWCLILSFIKTSETTTKILGLDIYPQTDWQPIHLLDLKDLITPTP